MLTKENIEYFIHPDRRPIRKGIYLSIVRSAEEFKIAEQKGEYLKLFLARGQLLYNNLLGIFDDIQPEEASMAMKIGFYRAQSKYIINK